jgi:redox-sensitive bicupin YhaK (pirin superfamily)
MNKQIRAIVPQQLKQNMNGFATVDMFHTEYGFEPFLVFTEFHMSRPVFGPHPHAGVSVMTYMLPDSKGSFLNRDSRGDHSIIEPGGLHVTQAGRGIKHDEVPTETGIDCHGFQIWINHSDKDRLVEPKAFHAFAKDVPEFENESMKLRVVQGNYKELSSPIKLVTQTLLFDVTLQPNASAEFEAQEMAFIYLISGELMIDGTAVHAPATLLFEKEGNSVFVQAGSAAANFLYVTGTPHHEPIVHGGPFVMTTNEQMHETKKRLGRGEMGELLPLAIG